MLHKGIHIFLILRKQSFILSQDRGKQIDMSDNIFLVSGDIKDHYFGEEPNEEIFEYGFYFYHFGSHLLITSFEEG